MESHNHRVTSSLTKRRTGVGGILRDVFTMGRGRSLAQRAVVRGSRSSDDPHLVSGVVAGIGGYGNPSGSDGGGSVRFDSATTAIFWSRHGGGLGGNRQDFTPPLGVACRSSYLGSKTGRDASTAPPWSCEFGENSERTPSVQVGDPLREKRCSKPAWKSWRGAASSPSRMGTAGLTCSAVEMGRKGDLGVTRPRQSAVPGN